MSEPRQLPSPSQHDRAAICPASEALPRSRRAAGHWGNRGTALHQYLTTDVPTLGREEALKRVPEEYRTDAAVIDLSPLPACQPDSYSGEIAIAYDVDTEQARVLGQGLGRRYVIGPREMAGTIDTLGLQPDAALVYDYKTGHKRLLPVREMRQMRAYGRFAASAFSKSAAEVGTIKIREDGSSYFDRDTLDAFELAVIADELRQLADRVEVARAQVAGGEVPETVEGEHCRNCPSFDACPSKMALVRAVAAAPDALAETLASATPEQLALAYRRALAIEVVIKRVKESIAERACEALIPLGNGQVLGPVRTIDKISPEVAEQVLTEMFDPDFARVAVEEVSFRKATKESIENAVRDRLGRGSRGIGKTLKEALATIDSAGGITYEYPVRPHRPKEEAPPPEQLAADLEASVKAVAEAPDTPPVVAIAAAKKRRMELQDVSAAGDGGSST